MDIVFFFIKILLLDIIKNSDRINLNTKNAG